MLHLQPRPGATPVSSALAHRPRVDIIGIGVQKAATTWIFRALVQHHAIRCAITAPDKSKKELNFFNHYYERGYAWYHQLFEFGSWKNAEYSVLYFHDRNVPPRIFHYNPNVRLLLSLRNPIERAFSHHRHEIRRGRLPKDLYEFRKALEHNPSYVEQGRYAHHLARWLDYFDLEQLHIVDYDDISTRPSEVLREIYEFVGADSANLPPRIQARVNISVAKRSKGLEHFLKGSSRVVRSVFGETALRAVKATGVPTALRKYNRVQLDNRVVPPLTRDDLRYLREIFVDDNRQLGEFLGRDFSHWL